MKRSVFLAGTLGAVQAVACGSDGLDATVGVLGDPCGPAAPSTSSCGSGQSCGVDGRCAPVGYVLVTPAVEPLSETSVRLSWASPRGSVPWYEVRMSTAPASAPTVVASLSHVAPSETSAVMSGLTPGTVGRVVVAAAEVSARPATAPSRALWTPYGAINEDSVSSVTPLSGYAGAPYAEGMFVSAHFSMFFAHAYLKESSFVFDGLPSSPTAKPIYNFASPLIHYANDFGYPDVTDVYQIWSDGSSRVLVANQNRVLVYNHLPLSPETGSPDLILGQSSWTGVAANDGESAANARGFAQAAGACFNGITLYVRDNGNSRILGWHGWPTQMGQAADFVLGQPDMVSSALNNGGLSKATLALGIDGGSTLDCHGGHLAAVDTGNHRVLIWNTPPTRSGVPADVVLGQTGADLAGQGGAGGVAAGGMLGPASVALLDGGGGRTAIVVSDSAANRITEWDDVPTADGAPFDRVYGQPDRATTTANTGGLSMGSLDSPLMLSVDDENRFWVADFNNGRALRFDLDNPTAIDVFGQRDGASTQVFPGSFSTTRTAWTHMNKGALSLDPTTGLFVTSFARAMFWNTPPTNGTTSVSAIQGQPDALSSALQPTSATSISGFCSAVGVGDRVYWSDAGRILSKPGTITGANSVPDVILGNQDFLGNVIAPTTLDYAIEPSMLATDGKALLAVDGARIVGWRRAPTSSHTPIDFAIGQPNLFVNTADNGGVTAGSLGGGRNTMTIANGKLVVADPANHRVLIWNAVPSTTGHPADVVVGQRDFLSSAPGDGSTNMDGPSSVAVLDGKLIVSDTGNARLLDFDPIPATSGAAATTSWAPSAARFSLPAWFNGAELAPHDLGAYGGRLYVGQTGRILVIPDFFSL